MLLKKGALLKDSVLEITKRIHEKIEDYENYSFTDLQNCSLKTFFDLAQEFDSHYDFFCISVLIPKVFFDFECVFYLTEASDGLKMVCHSEDLYNNPPRIAWDMPHLYEEPTLKNDSFFIPIKGKVDKSYDIPYLTKKGLFGIFEINAAAHLSKNMQFFLEKYVNRIGYQFHNRMINEKNKEHLQFINTLVDDIGHNVIVPNMFFKLFFRRMGGKINKTREIVKTLNATMNNANDASQGVTINKIERLCKELSYINGSMNDQFNQIVSHYEQTSLFLETLLRRSHFEQGRYVLEPKRININEQIIKPQLNRYLPRLKEKHIEVDNKVAANPMKEIIVVADVGLISQAFANFFSNAFKYTRTVYDESGRPEKHISLEMQVIDNYFDKEKPGVKLNMFSTGTPLSEEDTKGLFKEGYRGKNIENEYGTGHGLQFIKEVVEMHHGVVGYEPAPNGNNFYFILPA